VAFSSIDTAYHVNRVIMTVTLGFSLIAAASLIVLAVFDWPRRPLASVVYGCCLLLSSLCSYLYNMTQTTPHRSVLRYLDHGAIFLLIAGTYTPFVSSGISGPLGIGLLGWIWCLALSGIGLKFLLRGRYDQLFVALYLALGWSFILALPEFVEKNSLQCVVLLVAGGVAYSIGAIVYWRGIEPWTGAVWHGCVLLGSVTHFFAVVLLNAKNQQ
jgi:hemolysin III